MILILRFCQLGIDKLVDVGKVSIDMIVNNFTVNQRAFMTGFDASGVVQNFLTHSQQLNKRKSVRLIYITPNKMSKKLHYVRNWEGKIISASSFAEQQQEELSQEPAFFMYEFLRSIIRKQCRYPFQLFKQFILFSEEDSSIEVTYKHMRYELELIEVNINAVCNLVKQKLLIDGFLTIKHAYEKKLRVQSAYYSDENIEKIISCITNVEQLQKNWLKWQVFGKLYENFKGYKLSKINLSKIEVINNDFTSKQLQQFQPFLNDKQNEIQVISSFIIQKSSENTEQQPFLQNDQEQCFRGIKIQKRKQYRSYQYKNDRLTSQKSVGVNTPTVPKEYYQKQTEELDEKVLITHKKQGEIIEAGSTNKQLKQNGLPQTQYIYLVRDYRKRTGTPTNYIKIPLVTENIKIVQIHTQKKKKKKKQIVQEKISLTEGNCQNCKYCEQFKQRRETMKAISQRLQFIEINKNQPHNKSCLEINQIENQQRLIRTEHIRQTACDNEGVALFPQTMRAFANQKNQLKKQESLKKEFKQIRRDKDRQISTHKVHDIDLDFGKGVQQGVTFKLQKSTHLKRTNPNDMNGQRRIIFGQSKFQSSINRSKQLNIVAVRTHFSQAQNFETKMMSQSCSHELSLSSQHKRM